MAIYGRSEAAIDSLQRVKMEDQSVDGSHGIVPSVPAIPVVVLSYLTSI